MSAERILIVEDEGVAALSLEGKLLALGYQSAGIAFSAAEAMEKASHERPDLVLMDIQLHGEPDGIEAASHIREALAIPVVYVTAFSDDGTIERAKRTDPVGYIMKPYRDQAIKTTIEIALNTHRMEKRLKASEEAFRTFFELSPTGTALIDSADRIVMTNATMARLFRWESAGAMVGKNLNDLLKQWPSQEGEARDESSLFPTCRKRGSKEYIGVTARGDTFWVRMDSCLVNDPQRDGELGLCLFTDISPQKELELALQSKADTLQESNERLRQFTSVASHDLCAPARTAYQLMSLLARENAPKMDDRGREFLGLAISETRRMRQILEDLLEYTKVSYAGAELNPVSLVKVMRDTLAVMSPEIDEKRASITYDPLPTVRGSETQLRRLFVNLLDNAMKYSRRRPRVRVTASETNDTHVISFEDNGIGIDEDEREKVFEVFYRGHSQGDFPGTGIGLASCRTVMENHRGRIWVTSKAGTGSTFHLAFPKTPSNS